MNRSETSRRLRTGAGLIVAGLCLAASSISLDITIVNVALPTLVVVQ